MSAVLDPAALAHLLRDVLVDAGLPARDRTDAALEVVTRTDGAVDYTFVLNHGREPITVDVPVAAADLLTGATVSGALTLDRFGAAVLEHPHSAEAPPSSPCPTRPLRPP